MLTGFSYLARKHRRPHRWRCAGLYALRPQTKILGASGKARASAFSGPARRTIDNLDPRGSILHGWRPRLAASWPELRLRRQSSFLIYLGFPVSRRRRDVGQIRLISAIRPSGKALVNVIARMRLSMERLPLADADGGSASSSRCLTTSTLRIVGLRQTPLFLGRS